MHANLCVSSEVGAHINRAAINRAASDDLHANHVEVGTGFHQLFRTQEYFTIVGVAKIVVADEYVGAEIKLAKEVEDAN